jgi:uroporphyrinogen decarboxylase
MTGAPADRAPWTGVFSLYGAALTECPLARYYTDPAAYVAGQLAVLETLKPDILFMPFALVREGEAFGAQARHFPDQPPNLRAPACRIDAFASIQPADIDGHPAICYLRESLRRLAITAAPVPVAGIALDPFALPVMLFGLDAWMEIFLFQPGLATDVLAFTTEHFVRWGNALLGDGAACIIIPSIFVSPTVLSQNLVRDRVFDHLGRAIGRIKGPVIVHHAGGTLLPLLALLRALPAAGFAIDARDDYAAARNILGPDRPILSGVDGPTLPHQEAAALADRVRALLAVRRDDRRFLFTTTGADVPLSTPLSILEALSRAASGE